MQGSLAAEVAGIDATVQLDEGSDHFFRRRPVERSAAVLHVFGVKLVGEGSQDLFCAGRARGGGSVHDGALVVAGEVDVRSPSDERLHALGLVRQASEMQSSLALVVFCVDEPQLRTGR